VVVDELDARGDELHARDGTGRGVNRVMSEHVYYEKEDLWRSEVYDSEDQQERFALCGGLIPEDAVTLLDVGAGQGAFLRWLELNRPAVTLHGIERSEAAVSQSVSATPIQLGSIDELPFGDRAVDVVTALEVVEHLPHDVYESGVRELARVAGRAIVVSVPYAEKRRFATCSYCGCRYHRNYHVRSFEPDTFATLFEGFALDRRQTVMMDDYLAGPLLRLGWRLLHGRLDDPVPESMCPQCGFHVERAPTGETGGAAWKRAVATRLPVRQRPRWMVGKFVRS
jgi:Methyltransferase domain